MITLFPSHTTLQTVYLYITTINLKQMNIIWYIAIGIVAGILADKITGKDSFGLFGYLLLGVIGSVIGGWLFSFTGIGSMIGVIGSFISAAVIAILLLWVIILIKKM